MRISYEKLFRLSRRKGIKPSDLRKITDIAPNTFTRFRKNETVSMEVLMRVADVLKCDIGDICEFIHDDNIE